MAERIVEEIELSLIDKNPDNEQIFLMNDIQGLIESISDIGFIGAIEVYKMKNGRYQISSGHRRYAAMKKLGRTHIPCIVNDLEDDFLVRKKLIESNINTRVLSAYELSKAILYYERILREESVVKNINKELARIFSITERKVERYKSISKMTESIQQLAQSPNFPYEAFYDAVHFTVEQQELLVDSIKDHLEKFAGVELTAALVSQYIDNIKKKATAEREHLERERLREQIKQEIEIERQYASIKGKEADVLVESFDEPVIDITTPAMERVVFEENKPVPVTLHKNMYPVHEIVEKSSSDKDKIDISYDLSVYVDRMDKLLKDTENIIADEHTKAILIAKLEKIVEYMKQI